MENIKYHNIKIVQKSKQIFVERGKIDTQNTHIHVRSLPVLVLPHQYKNGQSDLS